MVYADTNFFIGLMNESDEHHANAARLRKRFQSELETSLLTLAELLAGCDKHGLDPENVVGSIFEIAKVSGITLEEAMTAAHYMKNNKLHLTDALHCALAGGGIISADKGLDRVGIKRIWAEK